MKILFLSDDFPPKSFGGAGIITADLAVGIKKAGHDVYVITTIQDKEGIQGWREYFGVKVYDLYVDYFQKLSTYISLYNPKPLKVVKSLIEDIKPDVIHVHNIHNYLSYYCLKIARKYTDKVFLTTHDAMAFNYGKLINFYDKRNLSVQTEFNYKVGFIKNILTAKKRYNPIRNILIRYWLNKYPKKIFAISDRLNLALKQNGIKNIKTVHYGIDYNLWAVSNFEREEFAKKNNLLNKKVIFFGGRLSEAKGGKIMIDVLKILSIKNPQIILLIAGTPNDYAKYLLNYAKEKLIDDKIIFTGWLSREEIKKAYAICDICVTPSIYFDAFNLFNIEAGASSKPVIGTCFGGTPEIILDGKTGIIVNPNNVEVFADTIIKLLNNNELRDLMGKAGLERVKKYFNLDRFVEETVAEYLN